MSKLFVESLAQPDVGQPIQAADPLSSGSSPLKAGCGQDCPPYKDN
jgi:hypothetical protein